MSQQDYDNVQEEADSSEEDYHYTGEPEFDEETLRSNEQRSRFFLRNAKLTSNFVHQHIDCTHKIILPSWCQIL